MKKIFENIFIIGLLGAFFISGKYLIHRTANLTDANEGLAEMGNTTTSSQDTLTLAAVSSDASSSEIPLIKVTSGDAQLYQEPNSNSKKLTEINKGELLTLKGTTGEFYMVTVNDGYSGYLLMEDSQIITYEPQEAPSDLSEAVIVLDAGHGGADTGAISNYGTLFEKEVTLDTALTIQAYLEAQGATVILTREDDSTISLDEICETSIRNQADIFISLHFDSTESMNDASGTTTYYYYEQYQGLANTVNQSLADWLPLQNRGIEYGNYQVLRENTQPALLLELGYMNNDYDVATFSTAEYQANVANALVEGLTTYFEQSISES